jgi:nucleoside-diphosphate-sugar epimerase
LNALRDKRVAVTGATGFLGRYIVDVLLRRGARVIGVVRNPQRVPELLGRGVVMRQADLAAPDCLRASFVGADAVVSNAALVVLRRLLGLSWHNWEAHHHANVEGTRNVFDAVAAAGVRRVVHISSVSVYAKPSRAAVDEAHPQLGAHTPHTPFNSYQISKALSEQLAWRLAEQYGLQLTTIRPALIYGAFDAKFMAVFKRLARLPISLYPAGLHLSMVYAGDVAEAVARALEEPAAIGKAYNTTGDDSTFWQFAAAWKAAGGQAPRLVIPVPVPIRQRFDHRRASEELGWCNRPFLEALRETLRLEGGGAPELG